MGVYIKGMEMPTSCTNCERWGDCAEVAWFFASEDDYTFEDLAESELDDRRHPNCPMEEVKEPHGRLIDADALPTSRVEWEDIVNAPTIIEAEE